MNPVANRPARKKHQPKQIKIMDLTVIVIFAIAVALPSIYIGILHHFLKDA